MKKIVKHSLELLWNINVGMWAGMLIADMIIPLLVHFFSSSELLDRFLRVFGFIIVVSCVLFYRSYRGSRKAILTKQPNHCDIHEIAFSIAIALSIQFCASTILGYGMYLTGAGYYLGWIIYNGDHIILTRTDVPTIYYVLGTLITYPFYTAATLLGSKLGVNAAEKASSQSKESL